MLQFVCYFGCGASWCVAFKWSKKLKNSIGRRVSWNHIRSLLGALPIWLPDWGWTIYANRILLCVSACCRSSIVHFGVQSLWLRESLLHSFTLYTARNAANCSFHNWYGKLCSQSVYFHSIFLLTFHWFAMAKCQQMNNTQIQLRQLCICVLWARCRAYSFAWMVDFSLKSKMKMQVKLIYKSCRTAPTSSQMQQ